jgi:predicted dehydrogenase
MADDLKIAFIGAGNVNFGGGEGPWDHASRLETMDDVVFVGVADPELARARTAIGQRRSGRAGPRWEPCGAFDDWREMVGNASPDAVFIGVPPDAHGVPTGAGAMEVECVRHGCHVFVEKPLGAGDLDAAAAVRDAMRTSVADEGPFVGVGYMFRYHRAVERMAALLRSHPPVVFSARYCCAYSEIRKPEWWDVRKTGGLIVEQATHFVDLARYLCGEVEPGSVHAAELAGTHPLAGLADLPGDAAGRPLEAAVPVEFRPPRATLATWQFASGALGNLVHGALLHGRRYESAIEIWADGLRIVLDDPYDACRVIIREPGRDTSRMEEFADDDPYLAEDEAFVRAIRERRPDLIRSPYEDAFQTYALTCAIAEAARSRNG